MDEGIQCSGSNLSGVSAKCTWIDSSESPIYAGRDEIHRPPVLSEEGERFTLDKENPLVTL